MESVWDDLKSSARALRRSPGFAAMAAVIIGLGLAGSSTLSSLVDALLFHPFPVSAPETLVAVETQTRNPHGDFVEDVSIPDFHDLQALREVFSGVMAHAPSPFTVRAARGAERVWGEYVSSNYFDVLGVRFPLGRAFDRGDALAAVISTALWKRGFSADPEVVGKPLGVDGKMFTVIGVAPLGFRGTLLVEPPQLWIQLPNIADNDFRWGSALESRDERFFQVLARLNSGVTVQEARAAALTQSVRLQEAYPETNAGTAFRVIPAREAWLPRTARSSVKPFLGVLGIVTALVLTMTCSNVANLLLARALSRSRELAIRNALGASRARIARQILLENLLLYATGLSLSLVVTPWILNALSFSSFVLLDREIAFEPSLNVRVVAFTAMLALASGTVFGALPALKASEASLRTRSSPGRHRLARVLVTAQAAMAVTLLIGAVLFVRTLVNLMRVDSGFRSENVLLASVDFNTLEHKYDRVRGMAFFKEAVQRLRSLPQVRSVTWASNVPLSSRRVVIWFYPHERQPEKDSDWIVSDCNIVGPDYFATLGIPLVRGRDFASTDREDSREVAIVNESMARRYWPGADPVGRGIWVRGRTGVREMEIIGISGDVKQAELRGDAQPYMYLALNQRYFPEMTLHVRSAGDPERVLPEVRAALTTIDPDVPLYGTKTLSDHVARAFSRERLGAYVLAASAVFAVVLAALGVYGITAYSAAQRTSEVGIRMALGARGGDILALFVRAGILPVAGGVAFGLAASVLVSRAIGSLLFGVPSTDLTAFAGSAVLLLAVAALASYFPARRVSRVDLKIALQAE